MLRLASAMFLFVYGAVDVSFGQNVVPTPSIWVNQRGSILTIETLGTDGVFEGTYVNNAAGTACIGDSYLVEGKIDASGIRFEVAFADRVDSSKNCLTVTQWRGTVTGTVMETNWSLAYPGIEGLTLIGGSDKFDLKP